MRCIALLLTTALLACDTESEVAPAPSLSPPKIELETFYSIGLNSDAEIAAWEQQVEASLIQIGTSTPPDEYWKLIPHFGASVESWIGDPAVWDWNWEPTHFRDAQNGYLPNPSEEATVGAAKLLEDAGEEFQAAEMYVVLGNFGEAGILAELNFKEGEYGASAQVALWTDDEDLYFRSVQALYDADRLTDTRRFISRAFSMEQDAYAWAMLETLKWDPFDQLGDDYLLTDVALRTGDSRLLIPLIEQDMLLWTEHTGEEIGPNLPLTEDRTVQFIVALSQTDPDAALDYADKYLHTPDPLLFYYMGGYEASQTLSVRGVFDLFELVRHDDRLRERYIELLRADVNDGYYLHGDEVSYGRKHVEIPSGFIGEWEDARYQFGFGQETNLLYTHMHRSRRYPTLRQMWVELLDGLDLTCYGEVYSDPSAPHPRPLFTQEFGRAVLGLSYDPNRDGLELEERILLRRLSGEVPTDDVEAYWTARYNSFRLADRDPMFFLFDLMIRGNIAPEQEARLRDSLSTGDLDRPPLRDELSTAHQSAAHGWFAPRLTLYNLLNKPLQVAIANAAAHQERDEKGYPREGGYFDTANDAWGALRTVLPMVRDEAPFVFEAFVVDNPIPTWIILPAPNTSTESPDTATSPE